MDYICRYTVSFTTYALGKMRKRETALRFVIVKKIKSSLKDIREKTRKQRGSERFPDRNHPHHCEQSQGRMRQVKFYQIEKSLVVRPMTARTVENEEVILNTVEEDGTRSLAKIASPLGISTTIRYTEF
jgi:hypothetical protein